MFSFFSYRYHIYNIFSMQNIFLKGTKALLCLGFKVTPRNVNDSEHRTAVWGVDFDIQRIKV